MKRKINSLKKWCLSHRVVKLFAKNNNDNHQSYFHFKGLTIVPIMEFYIGVILWHSAAKWLKRARDSKMATQLTRLQDDYSTSAFNPKIPQQALIIFPLQSIKAFETVIAVVFVAIFVEWFCRLVRAISRFIERLYLC